MTDTLLRVMPLSTHLVLRLLIGLVQRLGVAGYLCLDDVIIEIVHHVSLVLLAFVVLQCLRQRPDECVSQVKHRWQLAVIQQGKRRPELLESYPPELRATA